MIFIFLFFLIVGGGRVAIYQPVRNKLENKLPEGFKNRHPPPPFPVTNQEYGKSLRTS